MSSQTLGRVAVVAIAVAGIGLGVAGRAQAFEPGTISVKSIPASAQERMFRDAIADTRQRSERIQPVLQLDTFRAPAALSATASQWAAVDPDMIATRDLVLRHWDMPTLVDRGGNIIHDCTTSIFRSAAQLSSVY